MNIFEALRQSHVIQRNLAERLLETSGDTPERRELFERLKNELFAHAVAEDRYFYILPVFHLLVKCFLFTLGIIFSFSSFCSSVWPFAAWPACPFCL